jgi:hypothetical protein
MTETRTTQPPHEAAPAADRPVHPANILLNLIAILLAPMFLGASGGDIAFARTAAIETVNAYRTRNQADLIAVAQIIAFGLAALGSLSLSMVDDISLSMTLRLRNNANALSRSAEQNRRAIRESRSETADIAQPPVDADYEAAVIAAVADSQKRVADSQKTGCSLTTTGRSFTTTARGLTNTGYSTTGNPRRRHDRSRKERAMGRRDGRSGAGIHRQPPPPSRRGAQSRLPSRRRPEQHRQPPAIRPPRAGTPAIAGKTDQHGDAAKP